MAAFMRTFTQKHFKTEMIVNITFKSAELCPKTKLTVHGNLETKNGCGSYTEVARAKIYDVIWFIAKIKK